MLAWDDDRWNGLKGGYRLPFDPRPLLRRLESGTNLKATWHELWNELHHQGDVGEASYVAVPHLVRIYRQSRIPDWNPYALVACIELARTQGNNPKLPDWLEPEYLESIQELAKIGLSEYERADNPEQIPAILSILAISKGARVYGELLFNFDEKELLEFDLPLSRHSNKRTQKT
jgi:hypothetical protein